MCVGGRSVAALGMVWSEIDLRSNTAISTYSIATTSPSHRNCSRQVVLSRLSNSNLPARFRRPSALSPGGHARISLVQAGAAALPRPERNFDTNPHYPYCYGSRPNNRLESIANAHTAADLHVRPVSKTALVLRSWAPRTALRNTRWCISRNQFDYGACRLIRD